VSGRGAGPVHEGLRRGLPFLAWMPHWRDPGTVRADLLAGLTGAIRRILVEEPWERAPLAVTFVATLTLSLEWAILLGLLTAMVSSRLRR